MPGVGLLSVMTTPTKMQKANRLGGTTDSPEAPLGGRKGSEAGAGEVASCKASKLSNNISISIPATATASNLWRDLWLAK